MVALLSMSGHKAAAAELMTTSQTNFVDNVLLASTADAKDASTKDTADNTSSQAQTTVQAPAQTVTVAQIAPAPVIITVQTGDYLSKIAAANNSTWQRIYDANPNIVDPNVINPGEQLRIPAPDEQLAERALPQTVAPVAKAVSAAAKKVSHAVVQASYPVSADSAKAFIYAHESGNNPNATNSRGCYGLGQDCNGVVRNLCGADYACQDAYFTRYAMSRYGSWAGALAFWQAHHWW